MSAQDEHVDAVNLHAASYVWDLAFFASLYVAGQFR